MKHLRRMKNSRISRINYKSQITGKLGAPNFDKETSFKILKSDFKILNLDWFRCP